VCGQANQTGQLSRTSSKIGKLNTSWPG